MEDYQIAMTEAEQTEDYGSLSKHPSSYSLLQLALRCLIRQDYKEIGDIFTRNFDIM